MPQPHANNFAKKCSCCDGQEREPSRVTNEAPTDDQSCVGLICQQTASTDEQALLARVRYNRLLDIFTGLACYHLQSHLHTSITVRSAIDGTASSSQVETDDVYVGLDEHGAHYVLPVQAKGGSDSLSVIQIWQDFRVATQKFPDLIARPTAAQFMSEDTIALFEFRESDGQITIAREKQYRLVPSDQLEPDELTAYRAAASI